ncbi:MAG: class I SAM-dependent methyltransferase [Lachnospiraceae bacterium]|nr:class I SAM-dependent methyltransferase [Lachnospiraceae bacterium]
MSKRNKNVNKDNKKFWQRYAPIYSLFMKHADAEYNKVCDKIKPYLNKSMDVLELACGTGMFTYILADSVNSWKATDFSENMVKEARAAGKKHKEISGLSFCIEDATNLPYKDASFDAVFIANALHIMPNPEKVLVEIKRVLKDDGIMFAPTFAHGEGVGFAIRSGFISLFGFKSYMEPTANEFKEYIENNGFKVMEYDKVGSKLAPICCMIAKK